MFDVGFSELLVIAIVALVVIGPERLPKVARTAGLLLGRLQRYVNDVKADVAREMQLDELKKLQTEMQESVRQLESKVTSEMQAVEKSVEETAQSTRAAIDDMSASLAEAVAVTRTEAELQPAIDRQVATDTVRLGPAPVPELSPELVSASEPLIVAADGKPPGKG